MKKSFVFSFLFSLILLVSCSPDKTEMWFEKDGSGTVEVSIDVADMADMIMESFESMAVDQENEETASDENNSEAELEIDMWENEEDVDSTITFYELMPDSVKEQMVDPGVLKNVEMNMRVKKAEEYAKLKIKISYDSPEHMQKIISGLNSATPDKGMAADEQEIHDMFNNFNVDLKNGILKLEGINNEEFDEPYLQEMIEKLKDPEEEKDEHFMNMVQLMFGGKSETVVHLPGKILFTNDPTAVVKGKTVTFKNDMLELIKEGKTGDKIIKFKN